MADWSSHNITLTAKGASALSKVQAGSGSLTITRVIASEQYVAESTLREVTSLSVENLPLTIIDRHEVQDGGSVIQVQLSNLYLGNAFTLNEIGVFATHSDNPSEEFLYIIAQVDADTGDKIPVYATTPVTATYDIYLYNVGADNVEITISSAGLVTYEALNKACDIIQRNTAYEVGDILHGPSLKKGLAIKCTVAGTTKSTDIDLSHKNVGDTVKDGGVTWTVVKYALTTDVPPLASALATPRKIELTGNVTGSADFDGSKDIQIATATPLCVPLTEHITWTVTGTNQGDYDSLQTALNEAKKYRPIAEGALITIKLLSGFELDEPIRVSRCDLRHVEITAEDSKVIANTSKVAALMPTVPNYSLWSVLNYLLFIQFYKAFAPTLRFILRKDNNNGSGYNNCNGIDYNYAQGYIDGGGCENFKIDGNESYGVNITCSNLSVLDSTFSDCMGGITANKNSSLHVINSTFTNFLNRGIALWGGTGEIQGCTITRCEYYGIIFAHCAASISEYNSESDSADTRRTKISNCGKCGISADFGTHVAVNRIDITGCRTGILLENSGNIVSLGADYNITDNTTNNYNIAPNTITSLGLILAS